MSDQKVILFGSFTEDETRLFLSQSAQKSCVQTKCSKDETSLFRSQSEDETGSQYASEKIELQFGLLEVSSNSVKNSGVESKQNVSTALNSKLVQSANSITKDSTFSNGKPSWTNNYQKANKAQENGKHATSCENKINNAVKKILEQAPPSRNLLPRGLINLGNLCFLNATLQALLSCSPFVHLLEDLAIRNIPKVGYPTLSAFVEFITDFCTQDDSIVKKHEKGVLGSGMPFSPVMFDPVLKIFTPDIPSCLSGRPRQEDAQEFLSFIMDQLHNELLKLEGKLSTLGEGRPLVSSTEDDGWETVGPKNKSAVTRTQSFIPSELSAIFGGQLKSVVKSSGNKASATVQPFLLLHLDILPDAVRTIGDALHLFSAPETLEGYRASTGKAGVVSASKSIKIQTLSKVLILHLMRFSYGSRGSTKLHKPVRFPLELVLTRDLLVTPSSEGRKYELVATISHHGEDPFRGHYTADTKCYDGRWLRYDDSYVTTVGTSKVLHDQAYVLFYKQL